MSAFKQPFGLLVHAELPFIVPMPICLAIITRKPWIATRLVDGKF